MKTAFFYETLRMDDFIVHLFRKKDCFYNRKSASVLMLEKLLLKMKCCAERVAGIRSFGWGDTANIGVSLKAASRNSQDVADIMMKRIEKNKNVPARLFGIDFMLVLKKFILTRILFNKYFFYELFLNYVQENALDQHVIFVDDIFVHDSYRDVFDKNVTVRYRRKYITLTYIISCLLMPALLIYYRLKSMKNNGIEFNGQVVCMLTMPREFYTYEELIGSGRKVSYITNNAYRQFFDPGQMKDKNIKIVELSSLNYRDILQGFHALYRWISVWNKDIKELGTRILFLFTAIVEGRSQAPSGSGNVYMMFEHHDLVKTIRNEFLKKENNRIVFFSNSPPTVMRHHPDEFYENYDIFCSPGKYYEDELQLNKARIGKVLRTGSYTIHKSLSAFKNNNSKKDLLSKFKAGRVSVTVLCPGICKPTYLSEIKLMELSRRIADETDARVFIRQKPFVPETEYQGFYESYTNGNKSMYLTGMEYELFDFLPVTDLFITTYSTSACEVAMRGKSIFFIDYMNHPYRFLFWENGVSDGLLLKGDEAFYRIAEWIKDQPDGPFRKAHSKAMNRFVKYFGYTFPDYGSYKENLLAQLEEHVFEGRYLAQKR